MSASYSTSPYGDNWPSMKPFQNWILLRNNSARRIAPWILFTSPGLDGFMQLPKILGTMPCIPPYKLRNGFPCTLIYTVVDKMVSWRHGVRSGPRQQVSDHSSCGNGPLR